MVFKSIGDNMETPKSNLKGLLKMSKQIYKKGGIHQMPRQS